MMISFLAALRGGVAFEDTLTRRDARTSSKEREVGAKVGLPSIVSLLGFDLSGRMGRSEGAEASEETKAVRQHTAASLFNALYDALEEEELVKQVETAANLLDVSPGDVIQIAGNFVGNPLEPVLAFFRQALPYFDMAQETEGKTERPAVDVEAAQAELAEVREEAMELSERASKAERSGNPAMKAQAVDLRRRAADRKRQADEGLAALEHAAGVAIEKEQQAFGIRVIHQVSEDLRTTPVQDTVINAQDFKAVLTMSTEFFTDATRAHLRAGIFRAVGKVTRVLDQHENLNLLRRTVLGAMEPNIGRDLVTSAVDDDTLRIETFDPIIEAPAIQVLPLAVFV
jgi:hypothetical protein